MAIPQLQTEGSYNVSQPEKRVRDIMKPLENFSTVSADTTVRNAVYILKNSISQEKSATHLLVFENKTLIGIVGIQELLAAIDPPHIRDEWYRGWNVSSWVRPAFWQGLFSQRCREIRDKPVRDIIQPITTTLNDKYTLSEAAYHLLRSNRNTLPVTSNGLVVGIVRSYELFDEISSVINS